MKCEACVENAYFCRKSMSMKVRFEPIGGKTAEIIEALMASDDMPLDDDLRFRLRLCIEEAVANIVDYAYEGGNGFVEVGTCINGNELLITLEDSGKPFNPLEKGDPDITLSAEERPIGGLGIFLCKQLMDDMTYAFENGRNILTMKKNIK